jgi:nucleotide-binding universal stress UspA family protein
VHRTVIHDDARAALIEASRHAQLAVVGARGRGELTGLLFGSVSQALLRHADCPLVVVRHTTAEEPPDQ